MIKCNGKEEGSGEMKRQKGGERLEEVERLGKM